MFGFRQVFATIVALSVFLPLRVFGKTVNRWGDSVYSKVNATFLDADPVKAVFTFRFTYAIDDACCNDDLPETWDWSTLESYLKNCSPYVDCIEGKLKANVTVSNGDDDDVILKKGDKVPASKQVQLFLTRGQMDLYPYDSYLAHLFFGLTYGPDLTPLYFKFYYDLSSINYIVRLNGTALNTSFANATFISDADLGYVETDISVNRSTATSVFGTLVPIIIVILTVALIILTSSLVIFDLKVEPPLLIFSATLMFSTVLFRNAQPNVPGMGTVSDYSSFMWCEVVIALNLAFVMLLWTYKTVQAKRQETKKKKKEEEEAKSSPQPPSTVVDAEKAEALYSPVNSFDECAEKAAGSVTPEKALNSPINSFDESAEKAAGSVTPNSVR